MNKKSITTESSLRFDHHSTLNIMDLYFYKIRGYHLISGVYAHLTEDTREARTYWAVSGISAHEAQCILIGSSFRSSYDRVQ